MARWFRCRWRALNQGSVGRMATGSSDGDEMVPRGLGGPDSPKARTFVQRGSELIRVKPHRMQEILPGDIVIKLSAGGAGVGVHRRASRAPCSRMFATGSSR